MRRVVPILLLLLGLVSCKQNIVSYDPTMRLQFSHDSVMFDTVFTTMGSSTRKLMVYNPNDNAIVINQVSMRDGKYFYINLDGENNPAYMHDITIRGGDSLFLFVRANVDPQDSNSPVLVNDDIVFSVNEHTQHIRLQAFGQNVTILRDPNGFIVYDNLHLTNTRPYLIYDTLVVTDDLTIDEGTTLYMHNNALIHAYGNVTARGSLEHPITIRGDRTDRLFDSVPYRVASGQWNGIYLLHSKDRPTPTYSFDYADIISGNFGLYVCSESANMRPVLTFTNGRIHNQAVYGMILQNVDATVINSEISNCASFCLYIAGGKQQFVHNTIASYFGYPYTNINIHNNIHRDTMAAVYINNLSKETAVTDATFRSCIITGAQRSNLLVATPLPNHYGGTFSGNYLQADSLPAAFAARNIYASDSDSAVFRNIYYRINEYRYYDFQLDSLSPARGIGDSLLTDQPTQSFIDSLCRFDRLGHRRKAHPDAGCYEYIEVE